MNKVVLLAHGSPDPRSGKAMHNFAIRLQSKINVPIALAFLDHDRPNLVEITRGENPVNILVVPILLSNAFHARFDVPKAIREAGLSRAMPPIGNPIEILSSLIRNAPSNVIVVSAGTSNSKTRADFREAVKLASTGQKHTAETAFVTGPESRIESRLCQSQDPSSHIIIPWLLAEGRLLDVVLASAMKHGATVTGNGLVEEATFLEYVSSAIQLFLLSERYPTSATVQ